ncbi:NAD(P)/FAD-dependent oxidoreductase [Nocardia takedensis]
MTRTALIVGASVGGVRTAQALRAEGWAGRIVLVGAESETPYDKPPLSKQVLLGEWSIDDARLLTREAAEGDGIELCLGVPAARLAVAEHEVRLADDTCLPYDKLVIATGASARPSPWKAESGVHIVRTAADCAGLRADLAMAGEGPVVVVGGGFIGSEVAGAARRLGRTVAMVDPLPSPVARVVGAEVADDFSALHRRHGVTCHFGTGVEEIVGSVGDLRIRLTDGAELRAATVVVGIGAIPNDAWLADSGLALEDGVLCDEYLRAVDATDVFAVGDVARWFHPGHGEHVRVEHWTNAVEHAKYAAHNIAHPDDLRSCSPVEYVWSDQYDWQIQIVGRPHKAAGHEVIGELGGESARGAVLYTDERGRLCGAVTVGWPKALVACRRLVGDNAADASARVHDLLARAVRA